MLEIFRNKQFAIRTAGTKENPLFVAVDVCKALEIENASDAIASLRKKGDTLVSTEGIKDSMNRDKRVNLLTEQGLYLLIMQSRKASAIDFQLWVTGEVLPQIRKTGKYELNRESYMIVDPIERAKAWIVEAEERKALQVENKQQSEKIIEDKPKVMFAEAVECSINSCLIGTWIKAVELDKGVKIGQNKVFKWLRKHGYLITSGKRKNVPMQKYISNGYFELEVGKVITIYGTRETFTPLITGKGQIALVNKILGGL